MGGEGKEGGGGKGGGGGNAGRATQSGRNRFTPEVEGGRGDAQWL